MSESIPFKFMPKQRVKVKRFKELVDKYGYIAEDELIPTPGAPFYEDMIHWCGKKVTIDSISYFPLWDNGVSQSGSLYTIVEDTEKLYQFPEEALEPIEETAVLEEALPEVYKTNANFYRSLDEFGRIVYITNWVRNLPTTQDVYSRVGQEKVKKLFLQHLDQPYKENSTEE